MMKRVLALGALFLSVSVGGAARAAPPPATCPVIVSVFSSGSLAITGSVATDLLPKDVGASREGPGWDADTLAHNLDVSLRGTSLTALEIADLKRRAATHDFAGFVPECEGFGRPVPVVEGKQVMTSEFTRPLFSSDGKIAVVAWSLKSGGRWGHGYICVARKTGVTWSATCSPTWIA